jgi:phosphatidate phosphatase APP1
MQDKLTHLLRRAANLFDSPDPLVITPFRGFANAERFFLKGRVLENEGIFEGKSESQLRNLMDMLKRIETDEVEDAKVTVTIAGNEFETITDEEGFFTLVQNWHKPLERSANFWLPCTLQLLDVPGQADLPNAEIFAGEVLFPSENASFGVITDIDDTVLQTHVTSRFKLKMLFATLFKDSHQRLPMEGIPDLLRALEKGGDSQRINPIFYVSDSPWNLYDLLVEFLQLNELPKGPILLRDYGTHLLRSKKEEKDIHKLVSFRQIMGMYPDLPFVMLGDTASKDADYYLKMAEEFSDRVLAIYIRQTRDTGNARRIAKLIEQHSHIEAVLVKESKEIWADAKARGLVANG